MSRAVVGVIIESGQDSNSLFKPFERSIPMNDEIKREIRKARLMQYEIAAKIGVSEYTLCRWFRRELTPEQRGKVLAAIAELKAGEVCV